MRGSIYERAGAALGALLLQALLLYLLIAGLGVRIAAKPDRAAQLLDFTLPPPPPPPPPEREPPPERAKSSLAGEAAPPNKVSRATEIEVPPPLIVTPPPVVTAPRAAEGAQASSGAAPVAGPGTGAGGAGNGAGGGGSGSGRGGTELRLLRGDITDRDYPRAAAEAGAQGTVFARWVVGVDGRVSSCTITRSSGNRDLDETTCRLVRKRFRYAPSRDANGKPYADVVTGEQIWELYDRPGRGGDNRED